MAVTDSNAVANQAVLLIGGNQPFVTGQAPNFDNSTVGKALQKLYTPCVQTVQRQFGWDASRNLVALTLSGNPANLLWAFEYLYPANGIQVWQLIPGVISDANDPLPIDWSVGNTIVTGVQTKVIWANLAGANAYYNNQPSESTWDPGFRETVVRLLASELAMAIAGKPDVSEAQLQAGGAFEQTAEARTD
jgi:hypothetical protein